MSSCLDPEQKLGQKLRDRTRGGETTFLVREPIS